MGANSVGELMANAGAHLDRLFETLEGHTHEMRRVHEAIQRLDVTPETVTKRVQVPAASLWPANPVEVVTPPPGSYWRLDQWGYVATDAVAELPVLMLNDPYGVIDTPMIGAQVFGSSKSKDLIIPQNTELLACVTVGHPVIINLQFTIYRIHAPAMGVAEGESF